MRLLSGFGEQAANHGFIPGPDAPMKRLMRLLSNIMRCLLLVALIGVGVVVGPDPTAPPRPAGAASGIPVMGPSILNANQLVAWFNAQHRTPHLSVSIQQLANDYLWEGGLENVRGDVAFAQSIVETGYFGFVGSMVLPSDNNFAGMGACDTCSTGRGYPSAQVGVRAQIQHLKNYADPTSRAATLKNPPVVEWYGRRSNGVLDPALAIYNFDHFFAKGRAPTWNQMGNGNWATAPNYSTRCSPSTTRCSRSTVCRATVRRTPSRTARARRTRVRGAASARSRGCHP